MIRLAMAGAAGRMGRTILELALQDKVFKIAGGLEQPKSPELGKDIGSLLAGKPLGVSISGDLKTVLKQTDVLIDFTHATAVNSTLETVVKNQVAYVLGTTNLDKKTLENLRQASKKIPIVQSPNMSVGVNLLFELTRMAAKVLGPRYDAEIAEIHHRHKKDAPSGTAMKLLEILAESYGKNAEKDTVFGRKGDIGARPEGQLGVLALRGGDVIGDHTVYFLGDGERIELSHRASSRSAFAQGALLAAKFVSKQKNGFYTMRDVLGMA